MVFQVPDLHSPVPIHSTWSQIPNILSVADLHQIAMVVIQAQSMVAATATAAPIVSPFTLDGTKTFRMLGWCGLNPTQERLIPPVGIQLNAETTKTGKNDILAHLLDPSNMEDEEVKNFLSKQLFTKITNQNFEFRYTTADGTSHHVVTPFAFPILDPTSMAHIDIIQQAEDRSMFIIFTDKKNVAKGPPPPLSFYTELLTVLKNYQALLKVLFGINFQNFTQVKGITTTVKEFFCRNNGFINEIQRDNLICEINYDSIYFFQTITIAADLHNGKGPKPYLESIHALIGANIYLSLQHDH